MARQQRQTRSSKTSKSRVSKQQTNKPVASNEKKGPFHLEFKNQAQKVAWGAFDQHNVLFLLGSAGTGKSHLACAFAISEILAKRKEKIILTRPIVEAGEALGFLPGDISEKTMPYMLPMYDCIQRSIGSSGPQKEMIDRAIEVAPIAFMRGRTFNDSVCIFDEAQNATEQQLKLFLTRFGENSKIIITGDPQQSDLKPSDRGLMKVVKKLEDLPGIGVIYFKPNSIVRHPLIASILGRLEDNNEKEV
jgi:phosphate starvation-inducible PhoH-like protein